MPSPTSPNVERSPVSSSARPQGQEERLTDDRSPGQWETRYPRNAWIQIIIELVYLVSGLCLGLLFLYQIAIAAHAANGPSLWPKIFDGASRHTLALGSVAIGGACGGFAFALKWLYHSVAHGWWNRDRIVWRFVVPLLSGTLALFTALMIGSGFIPIFSSKITEGPRMGAAYGFFVGFFSDNLLAALQKFADQTLGTLGRIEKKQEEQSQP